MRVDLQDDDGRLVGIGGKEGDRHRIVPAEENGHGAARQDLVRSEAAMTEHRDRETSLRNKLLTAQRLADSIQESAENEARTLVDSAN